MNQQMKSYRQNKKLQHRLRHQLQQQKLLRIPVRIQTDNRRTRSTQRIDYRELDGYTCYISLIEPKNIKEALVDEYWMAAMQEELNQFVRNDAWTLVPRTKDVNGCNFSFLFPLLLPFPLFLLRAVTSWTTTISPLLNRPIPESFTVGRHPRPLFRRQHETLLPQEIETQGSETHSAFRDPLSLAKNGLKNLFVNEVRCWVTSLMIDTATIQR
ncbi:uncharacterized protein LOC120263205 [Dioscorea cayenensis subsp. rotundata]|uniref:Uncharacterized protein LOC120263205 n=1 Tax=Dioscorea cayennensis subsp. rotundata TaxID=55577 RepID=A0AB40BI01_DIOCR|nr:uncharacterized protein LOC120263205 [Dioscorea cayenensis subsp. rotundata]